MLSYNHGDMKKREELFFTFPVLLSLTGCKNKFKGVTKRVVSLVFYIWSQHAKTNLQVQCSDSTNDELDDIINTTSLTEICDAQTNIGLNQLSVKQEIWKGERTYFKVVFAMKVCFCFIDKWDQQRAAGDRSSPAAPSPVLSDSAVQLFRELDQQAF